MNFRNFAFILVVTCKQVYDFVRPLSFYLDVRDCSVFSNKVALVEEFIRDASARTKLLNLGFNPISHVVNCLNRMLVRHFNTIVFVPHTRDPHIFLPYST